MIILYPIFKKWNLKNQFFLGMNKKILMTNKEIISYLIKDIFNKNSKIYKFFIWVWISIRKWLTKKIKEIK